MEFRELDPTMTDVHQLEQVGFSKDAITALERLKALYQRGASHEAEPSDKRLAFVRWLYQQGRLHS